MHKLSLALLAAIFSFITSTTSKAQESRQTNLEEYQALGRSIEKAIADNNTLIFEQLFDRRAFTDLISGDVPASERAFYAGFTSEFDLEKLARQSIENFGSTNYRFMRAYVKDGQPRLLFRLFGDAGINYHEFVVAKIGGSLKLVDVFTFTLGESMSDYYRHTAALARAGMLNEKSADVEAALQYGKLIQQKNYAAIVQLLETSPSKILQYRTIQQYHIMASKHLGDSNYMASLDRFTRLFPDAPNAYLYQIDAALLSKNWERGLVSLNKLDSAAGGDPWLDFMRGNVYYQWGKIDEAAAAYAKLYASDPLMHANTRSLIYCLMNLGSLEPARQKVKEYAAITGHDKEMVASLYTDFPELMDTNAEN